MSRLRTYTPIKKSRHVLPECIREGILWRSDGFCEIVLDGHRCSRRMSDFHHVVKRSQGGEDSFANVIAICRSHHDRTDWPYTRGRLLIRRSFGPPEIFVGKIVTAPDKFTLREAPDA